MAAALRDRYRRGCWLHREGGAERGEALRILRGMGGISVVLTDMHSETSNGLELARYTKAQCLTWRSS